jgi:hypothetical protein
MTQGILDSHAKDRFWNVVVDCLVQFHHYQRCDAEARASDLRRRVETAPQGLTGETIYHDEPFDVAGDIAGQQLDLSKRRSNYDAITQLHNW